VSETRARNRAGRRGLVVEFSYISGMTSYRLGYARVSTLEQDPAAQLDALAAAAVDQVFLDQASGALTERPELIRLLAQIRPGDTLVVWRLDRLGRSTSHLIQTVTELGERGIGFLSLTEAIDTTTSAGRLLFGILASLAAFERDLIRERTMAGLTAARARGNLSGRPSRMTPEKLREPPAPMRSCLSRTPGNASGSSGCGSAPASPAMLRRAS
jgi:DNA invertase Pin-like site-specific DNA recombinase